MFKLSTVYLIAIFALGIGICLGLLIGYLRDYHRKLMDRIQNLETEVNQPKSKVHTHSTVAAIEDAIAVDLDLAAHVAAISIELNAAQQRLDWQIGILRTIRQGPHAYNPDTPAQPRKPIQ